MSDVVMNPTEKYVKELCEFLSLKEEDFTEALEVIRRRRWQRWGGATVEITVGEILYVLVRLLKPDKIFEGGTHWGYSTAHMAQALNDNCRNAYLVTCEIDQGAINKAEFYFWDLDLAVGVTKGDSVSVLKAMNQEQKLDFVFIDTSHDYETTKKEWEAMLPMLTDKSVVTFHDAFTDSYGVKRFLQELVSKHPEYKLLILDTQTNTGFGVIRKNV